MTPLPEAYRKTTPQWIIDMRAAQKAARRPVAVEPSQNPKRARRQPRRLRGVARIARSKGRTPAESAMKELLDRWFPGFKDQQPNRSIHRGFSSPETPSRN